MGDGTLKALRRRAHTLRTRASEPSGIKLADKLLFCAGVTFIPVTEWVMIVHPHRFSYWYTASILLLLSWRAKIFTAKKWHYFLLDFCYFINAMCLAYLALTHRHPCPALFRVVFSLSNGPLLVAIAVWRNSFVFHSVDRVTTTLVHALPPCLTYCLRWYPVETDGTPVAAHRALDAYGSIGWSDILCNSMAAYFLWQLAYIVQTELVFAKRLQADHPVQQESAAPALPRRGHASLPRPPGAGSPGAWQRSWPAVLASGPGSATAHPSLAFWGW